MNNHVQEITKTELMNHIRELGKSIVLTKNKHEDSAQYFRNNPLNNQEKLDGYWRGRPRRVREGHDYAAHFIERDSILWLGQFAGYVQDCIEDSSRYSIIIENPTCYYILDIGSGEVDDGLVRSFLKKPGSVVYTYYHPDSEAEFEGKDSSYKAKLPFLRSWLIEVARSKEKITYGQVMEIFGLDRFSLRHAMDLLGHESVDLNEPIITALIVGKKDGHCSEGLYNEFGVSDDEKERKRLYEYWSDRGYYPTQSALFEETDLAVKAAHFVCVEARPDQAAFRRRVYLAYKGKCAISGCDVPNALDAAHKHGRDWRSGKNSKEDGYLLRKDLHALYDSNLLIISSDGEVELDGSVMKHYGKYNGVRISCGK